MIRCGPMNNFTTKESEDEDEDSGSEAYPDEVLKVLRGLKDGEVADNIIETDRGEIFSLKVKMPERFDRRLEGGIFDLVSDLLATIVLSGWFELKLPEKVKTYNDKAIALSSEIRGELLYRVSPVRENRKDYGLDNYIFDQVYGKCTDCPSQG